MVGNQEKNKNSTWSLVMDGNLISNLGLDGNIIRKGHHQGLYLEHGRGLKNGLELNWDAGWNILGRPLQSGDTKGNECRGNQLRSMS